MLDTGSTCSLLLADGLDGPLESVVLNGIHKWSSCSWSLECAREESEAQGATRKMAAPLGLGSAEVAGTQFTLLLGSDDSADMVQRVPPWRSH